MKLFQILGFLITFSLVSSSIAGVDEYVEKIKLDSNALYSFFKKMPKGGELHYHFSGSLSVDKLIKEAAQSNYCIDPKTLALSPNKPTCVGLPSSELLKNKSLYNKAMQAWSMKNFTPTKETGHDHFFSSFSKFGPITYDKKTRFLADILQHAADQHELYLEIQMYSLWNTAQFAKLIESKKSFSEKRQLLLENPEFQSIIKELVQSSKKDLALARQTLKCNKQKQKSACSIEVKFQFFVKRSESIDSVFAQALAGFIASTESNAIVGINFVEAEDDKQTLKNYKEQMKIVNYLHTLYPSVHIALHAGELVYPLVQAKDLSFHIHDAVFVAHAERIGHGVDILHEKNYPATIKYMAQKPVAVEVNLRSNKAILNVSGKAHPFNFYVKNNVPVVLSTDDEGILVTDLTQQYVDAVIVYHLDYPKIKTINRNALTYSFLPGKSLWSNPMKGIRVSACHNLHSQECKNFIRGNEKANLQWKLENQLLDFERQFKTKTQ